MWLILEYMNKQEFFYSISLDPLYSDCSNIGAIISFVAPCDILVNGFKLRSFHLGFHKEVYYAFVLVLSNTLVLHFLCNICSYQVVLWRAVQLRCTKKCSVWPASFKRRRQNEQLHIGLININTEDSHH